MRVAQRNKSAFPKNKIQRFLNILTILSMLCSACQSTEEKSKTDDLLYYGLQQDEESSYTLFPGVYSQNISVVSYFASGKTAHSSGFRLWDVDQDGVYDMLESLEGDGKVYYFDFNKDGVLDSSQDW